MACAASRNPSAASGRSTTSTSRSAGRGPCATRRQRRRQVDDPEDPERRARAGRRDDRGGGVPLAEHTPEARARRRHRHELPGDEPGPDPDRRAEHVPHARGRNGSSASSTTRTAERRATALFEMLEVEVDPQRAGGRPRRRPAAAHRDRQGDPQGRQSPDPRRAVDGARRVGRRAAVRLPAQAEGEGCRDHLLSATAWTRSRASPTARRSCATAAMSSPRRWRNCRSRR